MPNKLSKVTEEVLDRHVIATIIFDFWGSRKNNDMVNLHELVHALTGYGDSSISSLRTKYLRGESLTPAAAEKRAQKALVPDPKIEAVKKVVEGRERDISVHEIQVRTNAQQAQDSGANHWTLTRAQCYKILDLLGYSSKKPCRVRGVDDKQAEDLRMTDLLKLLDQVAYVTDMREFVFVDECSINLRELYGERKLVSKKGEKAYSGEPIYNPVIERSYSALVFISLAEDVSVHVIYENLTANIFDDIVQRFLDQTRLTRIHLLLDNAPVHSARLMNHLKNERDDLKYSFLPRYSPDTNAAEYVHHMLKTQLRHSLDAIDLRNHPLTEKTVSEVFKNFAITSEARRRIVNNSLQILEVMKNHSYKEAVNYVKKSK